MSDLSDFEILLAVQRILDRTPRWRLILRWEARRTRERLLRRLVLDRPPKPEPPVLRRV